MTWDTYSRGPGGPDERRDQDRDPWGRTSAPREPSGYVTNDPWATPAYNQQSAPFGQPGPPPFQAAGCLGQAGRPRYAYTAAHPPRPSVGPVEALTLFFKNYAVFHGRASRSEYWWMCLWSFLFVVVLLVPVGVAVVAGLLVGSSAALAIMVLAVVAGLAVLVPSISLQVRRLHDAGFSGFFTLFAYVPYLSSLTWVVPFIMSFFPSAPSGIRYDNPNGTQPAAG